MKFRLQGDFVQFTLAAAICQLRTFAKPCEVMVLVAMIMPGPRRDSAADIEATGRLRIKVPGKERASLLVESRENPALGRQVVRLSYA